MNNDHNHKKISDKVLEVIDSKEVKPTSKLFFRAKNISVWLFAVLSVVVGAFVISIIIFRLSNASLIREALSANNYFFMLFAVLPFVWVLLLGVFGYVAYKEIRHTRQGYKYEFTSVMLIILVISGVLGMVLHGIGSGYMLDSLFDKRVPFHRGVEAMQREKFVRPEDGFLGGQVIDQTQTASEFQLQDPVGKTWRVSFDQGIGEFDKKAFVNAGRVRVIGSKINDNEFVACRIIPWEMKGKGVFKRMGMMPTPMPMRFSSTSKIKGERNKFDVRNTICEGVRPLTK